MSDFEYPLFDGAVTQFNRDGYIVVPSVFSRSVIDQAKAALLREIEAENGLHRAPRRIGSHGLPKQAAIYPAARELLFSRSVISIVKQLLGHQPIYFGDSGVKYGPGYTGWHKDNRTSDRKDGATPDWLGDYDLVRVGIYLQDCARHSGGLLVRAGSNNSVPRLPRWVRDGHGRFHGAVRRANAFRSRFYGKARFVNSRTGDIVVWSLRTTHAGHAVRIKGVSNLLLDPRIQQVIPEFLRVSEDGTRVAAFTTFARPGLHYDRYRKYLVTRDYFVNRPYIPARELVPATVTVDELKYSSPDVSQPKREITPH